MGLLHLLLVRRPHSIYFEKVLYRTARTADKLVAGSILIGCILCHKQHLVNLCMVLGKGIGLIHQNVARSAKPVQWKKGALRRPSGGIQHSKNLLLLLFFNHLSYYIYRIGRADEIVANSVHSLCDQHRMYKIIKLWKIGLYLSQGNIEKYFLLFFFLWGGGSDPVSQSLSYIQNLWVKNLHL